MTEPTNPIDLLLAQLQDSLAVGGGAAVEIRNALVTAYKLGTMTQEERDQVLAEMFGSDGVRAANTELAAEPLPVPAGDGIPLALYTKLLSVEALTKYGSDAVLAIINASMLEVAKVGGNPLEATYQLSGTPQGVLLEVEAVVQS